MSAPVLAADPGLDRLNVLPFSEAVAALRRCCGAERWAQSVALARPFADREALFSVAEGVWRTLAPEDWQEAFSHHPRIGERRPPEAAAATAGWTAGEQAGAHAADTDVQDRIADGNRRYEARFGHIYLVCATGRSGPELLAILESRLTNDPETELRVAAGEQEKITRLRLEKLLTEVTP